MPIKVFAALAAAALLATAPATAWPAPAHLTAMELDPARLLPPPPAEHSAAQAQELKELHRLQDSRTPQRLGQAKWDAVHEDPSAFAATLGPAFDLARLPATTHLLSRARAAQSVVTRRGKAEFARPRPWAVDPTLVGCDHTGDGPLSSYPSGHTTFAFTTAVVLAELMPEHASALLARAADYGHSRMVCGVHYPTDTIAGETLGTAIAVMLLNDPAMGDDITAARAELARAGLTAPR